MCLIDSKAETDIQNGVTKSCRSKRNLACYFGLEGLALILKDWLG